MPEIPTKLLIVDDESSIRTSMSLVLTEIGYRESLAEERLQKAFAAVSAPPAAPTSWGACSSSPIPTTWARLSAPAAIGMIPVSTSAWSTP